MNTLTDTDGNLNSRSSPIGHASAIELVALPAHGSGEQLPVSEAFPNSLNHSSTYALLRSKSVVSIKPPTAVHVVEGCQGGVGTAVRNLIEQQRQDPGIGDIHLFADETRIGEVLRSLPVQTHFYQSSRQSTGIIKTARWLRDRLTKLRPDVVYLHSTFPGIYGRLFIGTGAPWTTIYCAHGWAFTQEVPFARRVVYAIVERALASRTDAIVSISHHEFRTAQRFGVTHPRHTLILHGTHPAKEAPMPSRLRHGEHINVLFIGRFDRQKGVDALLATWKDARLKNLHLWLIGADTLGRPVEVPSLPNVHALGWVKHDDIDSYIRSADVVIIPSRWEGFGLVALEAMRNGKPIIANRVGGLKELVIEGANGHFFDLKRPETLVSVLSGLTKQRLAAMGSTAKSIFQTGFDGSAAYEQWARVTVDALNERESAASVHPSIKRFGTKRLLDLSASLFGLLLLAPALIFVALLVKATSRGPVLFRHNRCGQNGRTFCAWKFRTMIQNADRVLQDHLNSNPDAMEEWRTYQKLRNDPRVTLIGSFLRRFSMDELPQLLNVLVGDMSLVGPRPIVHSEIERYAAAYDHYCQVRPGLTGLWQVSGRNNTTYAERIEYDRFYVRNWSLWLDLSILIRTFRVVLLAEGAY